jgi:hypothetical protein
MARSGEAGFLSQVSGVGRVRRSIGVVGVDVSLRELCCRGEVFDRGAVCVGGGSQTAWGGRGGGEFGEAAAQYVVLDAGEELRGPQAVVACSYIGGAKGAKGTRTPDPHTARSGQTP